ncbi:5859_t:CDS:1, partial [Funneliformis caledonium]
FHSSGITLFSWVVPAAFWKCSLTLSLTALSSVSKSLEFLDKQRSSTMVLLERFKVESNILPGCKA